MLIMRFSYLIDLDDFIQDIVAASPYFQHLNLASFG